MALDHKEQLTGDEALVKVRELLRRFQIAMMLTVSGEAVSARPLGVVGDTAGFDGTLWFITDERSGKVRAIESGAQTSLIFQNEQEGAFLHLTGRASIVDDRAKLKELYTPVQRTWFPDGPDDPNMTLIRFDADKGNYWDKHDSMLRLLVAFTKSAVTGAPGKSGNAGTANLP
jgi:general stress protein 26